MSDGERKMLDHMKTYLLEAKVAESNLSEQERTPGRRPRRSTLALTLP